MTVHTHSCLIRSADHMAQVARQIAKVLHPGDCLLLHGVIGAGKSHFARNLIQSLLAEPEDVPSPTFTLVQVYDGPDCEIWHSDLYRLSALDEVFELGLVDTFDSEITLVEWPEKLEDVAPEHALKLSIALVPGDENARDITFEWSDLKWSPRMNEIFDD